MKHTRLDRIWSLVLSIVLVLPLLAVSSPAKADVVTTNGNFVPAYSAKDTSTRLEQDTPVAAVTTNENGWYHVPYIGGGMCYVRQSDVFVTDADPTATPTATATPTPTAAPSSSAGATATPVPTPTPIPGAADPSFEGTILKYTTPTGGLWLHAQINGEQSVNVKQGTTLSLSEVTDVPGWYSTYFNGATYYVPASHLYSSDSSTNASGQTTYNTSIRSVVIAELDTYGESTKGAYYYSALIQTGTDAGKVDKSKRSGFVNAGQRINARYADNRGRALVYVVNGKNYFLEPAAIATGQSSTAEVGDSSTTNLLTSITLPATSIKLYTDTKETSHITHSSGGTFYGVYEGSDWFKLTYTNGNIYYVKTADLSAVKRVTVNSSINSYSDTSSSNPQYLPAGTYNVLSAGDGWYKISGSDYDGRYIKTSDLNSAFQLRLPQGTQYYAQPDTSSAVVGTSSGELFEGMSYNSDWYQIWDPATSASCYALKADISEATAIENEIGDGVSTSQVAYNESLQDNSYWVTAGQYGVSLYRSAKRNEKNLSEGRVSVIQAGTSFLATPYNDTWYTYVAQNSDNPGTYTKYYFVKNELAGAQLTSSMSAVKARFVNASTTLYTTDSTSSPSITATFRTDMEYTVKPVNNNWYSITYNKLLYYVEASSLDLTNATPVPLTTAGKEYTLTIGLSGGMLYRDTDCTQEVQSLAPGTRLKGKAYSTSLYLVDGKYYLPISQVSGVVSSDDAADAESSGNNTEIVSGETLNNYTGQVLAYTVPTGGLWLYYDNAGQRPAVALNAGVSLRLMEADTSGNVYTTWYGGSQYYVLLSTIQTSASDFSVNYSMRITEDTALFSDADLKKQTAQSLKAGARVNVQVGKKDKNYNVTAYKTQIGGTWYFFPASKATGATTATVDASTNLTVMRKFTFSQGASITLYVSASTSAASTTVTVSNADGELILYGTSHNNTFYQVIYEGQAWYLLKSDYSGPQEYLSVSEGNTNTTFSVVIGSGGAQLYSRPATNEYKVTVSGTVYNPGEQNAYKGYSLSAGQTVLASKYNDTWYTLNTEINGVTRKCYFRTTNIAGSNSVNAISSIVITLDANSADIPLYETASTSSMLSSVLPKGKEITLRKVSSDWYTYFHDGYTRYVRRADIPTSALESGTPIASTTVGKSYQVILGASDRVYIPYYGNIDLTGGQVGQLRGGTKVTATKRYVNATIGIVYSFKLDGLTRYVEEKYVTSVVSGDEAEEAANSNNNNNNSGNNTTQDTPATLAVGGKIKVNLAQGAKLYLQKDTAGSFQNLYAAGTYELTKIDANWFELVYNDVTSYIPLADIASSSTGGTEDDSNIAVGTTITHTLKYQVNLYAESQATATILGTLKVGTTAQLKKVSDTWYTYTSNGNTYYIKSAELYGKESASSGQTTDGTGIITATVQITPNSGTVNMRKQPNATSVVLERIPKGEIVSNLGYEKAANGDLWYKVKFKGLTGYVLGTFVTAVGSAGGSSSSTPEDDINKVLTINVVEVNIRVGAGPSHRVITKLYRGDTITPTGYVTGDDNMYWYKFNHNGTTAYIRYDYVTGGLATNMELSGNVAVKAGGTNLRKGAGEGFGTITQLARDVIVTIIGTGRDSDNTLWYHVTIDGLSGYLRHDLVRSLTSSESSGLVNDIVNNYTELRYGSSGEAVLALQQQLIRLGYMTSGQADGTYGVNTTNAVTQFQKDNGLTQTGVATAATQAAIFNTSNIASSTTTKLDWFTSGYDLINANPNIQIYDIQTKTTWSARYVEGKNHADVVPASAADAQKLKANNITGSYERRPVIVTVGGQQFAGSMYAVGHGSTNFVSFFTGVMCLHFTGSKTHGTGNVDSDHQSAIQNALDYATSLK